MSRREQDGYRRAWRLLTRRRHVDRAVSEEVDYHLERSAEWIAEREGLPMQQARREARRRFGDDDRYQGECVIIDEKHRRSALRREWWNDLLQDGRFGLRQIRRSPGITFAAVLCLAIGIGATTSVYEIARYALYSDTAIREPDRVVRIYTRLYGGSDSAIDYASYSWLDYLDLRQQATSFSGMATGTIYPLHLADEGLPSRVWGEVVTGDYFRTLGIPIILGRDFAPEDEAQPGAAPEILLMHRYWRLAFGGDPGVIGRRVTLNGHPFTVIGVVDAGYAGMMVGLRTDILVPMAMQDVAMPDMVESFTRRDSHWLFCVIARLRPGITFQQATAEVEGFQNRQAEEYPESSSDVEARVVRERDSRIHPLVRDQLALMLSMIGFVVALILLLTCANVAGLLLARASSRRREMGIRLSLGAERRRIMRQVFTESILLAAFAGVLGFLLSQASGPLLAAALPPIDLPFALEFRSSPLSILFVMGAALAAGLVFGMTPAIEASRQDLIASLTSGRSTAGRRTRRARRLFVVLQVSISLTLLIASGMVLRSLQNAQRMDVGFDHDGVLIASVFLELQGYDDERSGIYRERALEELRALPGVAQVATGYGPQLSPTLNSTLVVPEDWAGSREEIPPILYNYVDEAYFETLRIPVLSGRTFTPDDDQDSLPVVVINQAFADRFWPGSDPIGRRVASGDSSFTVVGVVPTGKYFGLGEAPRPYIYWPIRQLMQTSLCFFIRSNEERNVGEEAVRTALARADATLPVADLSPLEAYVDTALLPARVLAGLVTAFATLALLLASIGLFGLIAYRVSQQGPEIGIRVALGARPGDVVRLVVLGVVRLIAIALVAGIVLGLLAGRALAGLLYGVEAADPASLLIAVAIMLVSCCAASWIPTIRALRVDPVRTLQAD